MGLDTKLVEILACPSCKSDILYKEAEEKIYCTNPACSLIFPVREGIPVMLIEEAEKPGA